MARTGKVEGAKEARATIKATPTSAGDPTEVAALTSELKKLKAKQSAALKKAHKEAQETLSATVKGIVNSTFKVLCVPLPLFIIYSNFKEILIAFPLEFSRIEESA